MLDMIQVDSLMISSINHSSDDNFYRAAPDYEVSFLQEMILFGGRNIMNFFPVMNKVILLAE